MRRRLARLLRTLIAPGLIAGVVLLAIGQTEPARIDRSPIAILSDAEFTAENGVRDGSGTIDNPYVISGWRIDAAGAPYCVQIENVSSVFRIEDCEMLGASSTALTITAASGGAITRCCATDCLFGIRLTGCERFAIEDCAFDGIAWTALSLAESGNCRIERCLFVKAGPAIHFTESSQGSFVFDCVFLSACRAAIRLDPQSGGQTIARNDFIGTLCVSRSFNRWNDSSGMGNYWSEHRAKDDDGDGIGDSKFLILGDAYEADRAPNVSRFHPEAEESWNRCGG